MNPPASGMMKVFCQVVVACGLFLGAAGTSRAQTGVGSVTGQRTTDGRILQPDNSSSPSTTAVNPARADRPALPPEIKQKLKQFEVAREAFIARQEQLRKLLQGATTDKERDAIRQRIKDS